MKNIAFLCFLFCSFTFADVKKNNFSFGLGDDHSGLGAKYTVNLEGYRLYGSLGLIGYSDFSGVRLGYGVGVESSFGSLKHGYGLFLGGQYQDDKSNVNLNRNTYGLALTYNYYFNGFDQQGFIAGLSLRDSFVEKKSAMFNDGSTFGLKIGYQW